MLDYTEILQSNKPNYSVKEVEVTGELVEIGTLNPGDKYGRYTFRSIDEKGVHWVRDDGDAGKWLGVNNNLKFKVRKK